MEYNLNVWRRGDQRAVHKPLLLLYVLSEYQKGHDRLFSYPKEIDPALKELLIEFGPYRTSHHTEYPFWRLQNDGFWALQNHENVRIRASSTDAIKSDLVRYNVLGGFSKKHFKDIKINNNLKKLVTSLLENFFPESIHDDLVEKLDIDSNFISRNKRNPQFRNDVLIAYEYSCAICGFDCRLGQIPVGLEAAHIKWHQNNGPSSVENGIAMCALHHKLFDRGVLTIDLNNKIIFSRKANGGKTFIEQFDSLNHKEFKKPKFGAPPNPEYILWHHQNIFNDQL